MNTFIEPFNSMAGDLFPANLYDDFFESFFDTFPTTGLKKYISRPHNIRIVKDEKGNPIGQELTVVHTPFSRDEVKISEKNHVLTIHIGDKNKKTVEKDETYLYKGISTQYVEFTLKLSDKCDTDAISAKANDGLLKIYIPYKKQSVSTDKIIDVE